MATTTEKKMLSCCFAFIAWKKNPWNELLYQFARFSSLYCRRYLFWPHALHLLSRITEVYPLLPWKMLVFHSKMEILHARSYLCDFVFVVVRKAPQRFLLILHRAAHDKGSGHLPWIFPILIKWYSCAWVIARWCIIRLREIDHEQDITVAELNKPCFMA